MIKVTRSFMFAVVHGFKVISDSERPEKFELTFVVQGRHPNKIRKDIAKNYPDVVVRSVEFVSRTFELSADTFIANAEEIEKSDKDDTPNED